MSADQGYSIVRSVASEREHNVEHVEASPRSLIVIPFSRDVDFVDQQAVINQGTILAQVDQKCRRPGSRTALVGLGGVGKSQLAIEYAYRIRERSPDTWVFWIHASNAARFEQSVRDIASCAEIFGRQDPTANIFQLVHDWLRNKAKGPWVVILDNVDNAGVLTLSSARTGGMEAQAAEAEVSRSLLSYIPHCQHGSVLVTSRSRSAALDIVEDADIIMIEPMNVGDGATLFRKKLSRSEAGDDPELIASLVASLEQMPLAIVQAAAYISQRWPRYSVQQYLDDYKASNRKQTGLLSYEGGKLRRDFSAKDSILITWQITFDYIRAARPSAADMLSLMSFCDRQGIPEMLLRNRDSVELVLPQGAQTKDSAEAKGEDFADNWSDYSSLQSDKGVDDTFEQDVLILRNYAFIRANDDGRSFEMHRLVQLATQEWLQLHGQKEHWRHQFLTQLCREMPTGEYANWATCRALFPHARWAAANIPKRRNSVAAWATVLYRAAWYCLQRGNAIEAERLSILAMKARKKIFEADHEEVLWAMSMVALAYTNQGRWKDAEELEVQVMETRKTKSGGGHPDTLTSMCNLASILLRQGRWKEAEKLEVQVLESRETKLGVDHPSTLTSMGNLASTYRNQGRLKDAEELEVQVMETSKIKLGEDHPSTLTSMGNLASTYRNQGRLKDAEELEVQVMETSKIKLRGDHPSTLTSMGNLASTYRNQGRWKDAEELEVQVMETSKIKLGKDHPSTLTSMGNLASTYRNQGRWKDAEELKVQMMERSKATLMENYPDTLTGLGKLASTHTHSNQRRREETEAVDERVLAGCEKLWGPDQPSTRGTQGGKTGGTMSNDNSDLASLFSTFSQSSVESYVTLDGEQASALALVIDLLSNHEELQPLYQLAIAKVRATKLKIHLYGFLRIYGKGLQQEAEDEKQNAASRFVRKSARHIAQGIASYLTAIDNDEFSEFLLRTDKQSKERTMDNYFLSMGEESRAGPSTDGLEADDGLRALSDVSNDEYADSGAHGPSSLEPHQIYLNEVRHFLVSSKAFEGLKNQLEEWLRVPEETKETEERELWEPGNRPQHREELGGIVSRQLETGTSRAELSIDDERAEMEQPLSNRRTANEFTSLLQGMQIRENCSSEPRRNAYETAQKLLGLIHNGLVWTGLREPPLVPGYQRVRWKNRYGKMLYDDYIEREPGALETLRRYLNTQGDSSASESRQPNFSAGIIAEHSEAQSSLHHHLGPPPLDSLRVTVNQSQEQRTGNIGIQNDLELATSSSPLHLFVCVERGRHKVDLQQHLITDVSHDRELFLALRQRYREYRGLLRPYWSLRTVHGIHFMKFTYGGPRHIDPRCHNDLCDRSKSCDCIPPRNRVTPPRIKYQCSPVPAKQSPSVGPRLIMDYFTDPDGIDPDLSFVLTQLPKRARGELETHPENLVEAWGIYFRQDWDWSKILWILGLGLFLPSLLFGVLWSVLMKDIQGAFGVAAWWMAGTTVIFGMVGTYEWTE